MNAYPDSSAFARVLGTFAGMVQRVELLVALSDEREAVPASGLAQ